MTNQERHKINKIEKGSRNQIIEISTNRKTLRRRRWRLSTRATGREANRMTHVLKVGTDEGARVLDLGGAEAQTVQGGGVLDPGGGI